MAGSKVIAKLGIIGSGNKFDIITKDITKPMHKIIAMYMKAAKCC